MCFEALLEFEESLAGLASSNDILLNNLELKTDLNRFASVNAASTGSNYTADSKELSEAGILKFFSSYDYSSDIVTKCPTCASTLGNKQSLCCTEYIELQKQGPGSSLERNYWTLFLQNPYKTMLTLPNYTKLAFHQMGVPFQLRSQIWRKLILVNQKNCYEVPAEATMIFANFQHSYNHQISKQIKKDLGRTFPDVEFFQNSETVDALLTVLSVYANYDLELGYCQGLLFLVGTLYQLLRSREFTFHTMCKIMECEPQLRSIFVPGLMLETLETWRSEFSDIFNQVDPQLYGHLSSLCDMSVFLFQWWLSNNLIHAPNLHVNNRIVEYCLVEGWKVGNFKVALGILLKNRPILMSLGSGDDEVVYQHLLNESKWGNIINNTTAFFGDLLVSWDDNLFTGLGSENVILTSSSKAEKHTVFSRFKSLSLGSLLLPETASEYIHRLDNRSLSSVFSTSRDNTSVFSESSEDCSEVCMKRNGSSGLFSDSGSFKSELDDVILENQALKFLLKKAYDALENGALKKEIEEMIEI